MNIHLHPNSSEIKIYWQDKRSSEDSFFGPIRANLCEVEKRVSDVRASLNDLNRYFDRSKENADPEFRDYTRIMNRLQGAARALFGALVHNSEPADLAKQLHSKLRSLPTGTEVTLHCPDDAVSIPIGFLADPDQDFATRSGPPKRSDFDHFWINQFKLTVRVNNCSVDSSQLQVEPESVRALYALHESEVEKAITYFSNQNWTDDITKFRQLTAIDVRDKYKWEAVNEACKKITDASSIVFVLAHSDGDNLDLGDYEMDSGAFARMIQLDRSSDKPELLILNCCASAAGAPGRKSLLSVIARRGFLGLIGTEAEISNASALRCGIRFMWNLCANGATLGEAFSEMQASEDLFPSNLFYTCYASRAFRLTRPMQLQYEVRQ